MSFQFRNVFFFIIFFCVVFSIQSFCQSNCICGSVSNEIEQIEIEIDKRNFDNLLQRISKLPVNTYACKKYQQLCYLQYYIEAKKNDKADSLVSVWKKESSKSNCDKLNARFYCSLGSIYVKKEIPDTALSFLLKAKDYSLSANDIVFQAKTLGRIASLFNTLLKEPKKALEYVNQALEVIKQSERKDLQLHLMCNRLAYYNRMYDVHENKLYLDTIFQGAIPALTLARQLAIPQRVGQTCSILAGFWFLSGNYTKALQYCDSGLAAIDRRVDTRNLNALTTKKSDIYFELHDFKNSKLYADSSLYCAQQDDNTMQIISAHERLYYIEKNIGNLPKALEHLEIFKTLNDSMLSVEKAEVTNELEQKYNKVSNEKKIKELSQTQEINSLRTKIIVVAALLIIMIILIVFQQRFSNTRMRIYEAEQRLNRARMNPHFFFNALASLQNFSLDDGNKEMITLYISKLSKIMRQSLESTFTEFVSVENEIDFLKNYISIQKLLNNNKFDFAFELDLNYDASEIKIPVMILQPFIENSIEHGFKNNTSGGMIDINFSNDKQLLKITITDNGQDASIVEGKKTYSSRALQIVNDRFFLLNKTLKTKAHFASQKNDSGYVVEIFLPLLFQE